MLGEACVGDVCVLLVGMHKDKAYTQHTRAYTSTYTPMYQGVLCYTIAIPTIYS